MQTDAENVLSLYESGNRARDLQQPVRHDLPPVDWNRLVYGARNGLTRCHRGRLQNGSTTLLSAFQGTSSELCAAAPEPLGRRILLTAKKGLGDQSQEFQ